MERAGSDEQDVVGLHRPVLGGYRGALDQRQQVALHALARDIGAGAALAAGDLVDLVEEHDAVVLHRMDGVLDGGVLVDELVRLLGDQQRVRLLHRHPTGLGTAAEGLAQHVAERDGAHLRAGHAGQVEHGHATAARLDLDLYFLVVQLTGPQALAKGIAGGGGGVGAHQGVEHPAFGGQVRLGLHILALGLAHDADAHLHQVADDLLHVAAHIAHLGELGGLHLQEGGARQLGEAAGNLGLAHAGGADHQDVLGQNLLAQLVVQLQPAPAVAQGNSHRALGIGLADDVAVELGDDLAGGKVAHGGNVMLGLGSSAANRRGSRMKMERRSGCQAALSSSTKAPRASTVRGTESLKPAPRASAPNAKPA